jgi:hypothetical protein
MMQTIRVWIHKIKLTSTFWKNNVWDGVGISWEYTNLPIAPYKGFDGWKQSHFQPYWFHPKITD